MYIFERERELEQREIKRDRGRSECVEESE
jgi:hypothetical protein